MLSLLDTMLNSIRTNLYRTRFCFGTSPRLLNQWLTKLLLAICFGAIVVLLRFRNEITMNIPVPMPIQIPHREFYIHFKNVHLAYWMDLPGTMCNTECPKDTKLLILIMTRRSGFERRRAIRETWFRDAVKGTQLRFLISDPPAEQDKLKQTALDEQQHLLEEQLKHQDLVFQHGIEDRYENLHLKWIAGLHWQQAFCAQTEFVLKTDDDTIVHLPRLNHWIERKLRAELSQNAATYFGWIISGVGPIRDKANKWFVPESLYPGNSYPDYMQGATYLASRPAIASVLGHTSEVTGFNMDDVLFTGVLADLGNVRKSDHKEMFRVGNQLKENETCEDGVPHVTALYGASTKAEFEEVYVRMNSVKCPGGKEGENAMKRRRRKRMIKAHRFP